MSDIEYIYRYRYSSSLQENDKKYRVRLACVEKSDVTPVCFDGVINNPLVAARCLRNVSTLVGARYFTPPNMLARILREADPVVTVNRKTLRFEGFSACCSTYARVDITEQGYTSNLLSPGTTNVDFRSEMRAALAKIRATDTLSLTVRTDEVELSSSKDTVIEKKVALPLRWIKGMAEVQAIQSGMTLRYTVQRPAALQFFRQLPRQATKHPAWLVATNNGLRFVHRETKTGVRVQASERLRMLEDLIPMSDSLSVYADENNMTSAWVLSFNAIRFTLVLSAEPWRGFSGEGQLLKVLVGMHSTTTLARVQSWLKWQEAISPAELAEEFSLDKDDIKLALTILASRGLVGYDVATGTFFHRVLPFDMSQVDSLHPRLLDARKLIESDGIKLVSNNVDEVVAEVHSKGVVHRVHIGGSGDTCTCPWFAQHQEERGPCKHILAVHILLFEKSK